MKFQDVSYDTRVTRTTVFYDEPLCVKIFGHPEGKIAKEQSTLKERSLEELDADFSLKRCINAKRALQYSWTNKTKSVSK